MADLDDIREGRDFGLGEPVQTEGFFLKGCSNLDWGMKDRLGRIFRPDTGRTVMLAFDHGFIMGPTSGLERIDLNIVPIAQYADCLMGARGIIRSSIPPSLGKAICLRSDAGSSILTELNHNVVIDIEDALRLNASAIAVMVSVGEEATEAKTMANLYHLLLIAGDLWIWLPHHISPHRPHKVAGLLWSLCCIIPLMTIAKVE
jgi:putative autoinducer-2 (AI-2) aldolase